MNYINNNYFYIKSEYEKYMDYITYCNIFKPKFNNLPVKNIYNIL